MHKLHVLPLRFNPRYGGQAVPLRYVSSSPWLGPDRAAAAAMLVALADMARTSKLQPAHRLQRPADDAGNVRCCAAGGWTESLICVQTPAVRSVRDGGLRETRKGNQGNKQ